MRNEASSAEQDAWEYEHRMIVGMNSTRGILESVKPMGEVWKQSSTFMGKPHSTTEVPGREEADAPKKQIDFCTVENGHLGTENCVDFLYLEEVRKITPPTPAHYC